MAKKIGTSTNTNPEAFALDPIECDKDFAVTLLPAQNVLPDGEELPRIAVWVHNDDKEDLWVRFYPASVDDEKKGLLVEGGKSMKVMDNSDIYTGEISGIMEKGKGDIYVTWY